MEEGKFAFLLHLSFGFRDLDTDVSVDEWDVRLPPLDLVLGVPGLASILVFLSDIVVVVVIMRSSVRITPKISGYVCISDVCL